MRLPAELLVLACLLVGIVPALTIGPLLTTALHAVLGDAIPDYSLALWHGFTPALLMSVVAICGGVALYLMLRSYLLVSEGPPLLRHIKGQRIFDRVLVAVSWQLARRLERLLGTRRLQPQLQLLICAALLAGFAPVFARGIGSWGTARTTFDIVFALIWSVGIACALAAAYHAKFHRFAALILVGGAGLMTCVSFRLAVGARSRADPAGGRDRHDGAASARAALAAEARWRCSLRPVRRVAASAGIAGATSASQSLRELDWRRWPTRS